MLHTTKFSASTKINYCRGLSSRGVNAKLGPHTVYSQKYLSLRRHDITQPNLQKKFDKDLCSQLRQWRLENCHILLTIYANAGLDDSKINRIVSAG